MERLIHIGFQPAGQWQMDNGCLILNLTRISEQKNVLYAFIQDNQVQYVGKTTKTLRRRMMGYLNPSSTQRTNMRNHENILKLLRKGKNVHIFAWADQGLSRYGDFTINLAAALEDSIIETLSPPWNGGRSEKIVEAIEESDPPDGSNEAELEAQAIDQVESHFTVEIGKTYFETGFFNVPVRHEGGFGPDKSLIDIYCGKERAVIHAWVSRRATPSGAPRIMGGAAFKNWIQANVPMDTSIVVRVLSQSEIVVERSI
ncbi:GIY-YIG nuclease family protein [Robbsia sp. Bb-Pol-6]|uniref:GIY-YIG nuclease family protein n=1 Tax=Robbsia betulipollinis TaxID=2981849 RepID=A0ABT3ZTU2_9BURK|nr:GIY-YIG nuclease family protein [Robbsia betulipollinis]MCY0389948.1 GIY-YIG nuclease family protein [Robbsia betulipollinis]